MEMRTVAGFGIGVLSGVLFGSAVALLLAPKSGKDTRKQIHKVANDVVDTVKKETNNVIGMVKDATNKVSRKGHATVNAIMG